MIGEFFEMWDGVAVFGHQWQALVMCYTNRYPRSLGVRCFSTGFWKQLLNCR